MSAGMDDTCAPSWVDDARVDAVCDPGRTPAFGLPADWIPLFETPHLAAFAFWRRAHIPAA